LLDGRGISLLRRDQDGTIEVESDGERWEALASLRAPRGPPDRSLEARETDRKGEKKAKNPDRLIDINSACLKELESLSGIGPAIARRIIEGRPFRAVDDLLRVKGIGEKRMSEVRPYVTAR
jgi:competence ComEA-like helix-hairpin-helix protein